MQGTHLPLWSLNPSETLEGPTFPFSMQWSELTVISNVSALNKAQKRDLFDIIFLFHLLSNKKETIFIFLMTFSCICMQEGLRSFEKLFQAFQT